MATLSKILVLIGVIAHVCPSKSHSSSSDDASDSDEESNCYCAGSDKNCDKINDKNWDDSKKEDKCED
jgi:hypothetical protein